MMVGLLFLVEVVAGFLAQAGTILPRRGSRSSCFKLALGPWHSLAQPGAGGP